MGVPSALWASSAWHRICGQELQIRLHTGTAGGLYRLLQGNHGLGYCRFRFSVQISLLGYRGIRFLSCGCFGPGFLCVLVPLPGCCCRGFSFHLLAGLTDFLEAGCLYLSSLGSSLPRFPLP